MASLNFDASSIPQSWFYPEYIHYAPRPAPRKSTFCNEVDASAYVRDWLERERVEFEEQFPTGHGAIDFVLKMGGRPHVGIEVKRDIGDSTNASLLADYMEQAHAYSRDLQIPVLLGPVITQKDDLDMCRGGSESISALAGLVIFGGRINVGLAAFNTFGDVSFILRGQVGFRDGRFPVWKPEVFRMVRSVNSAKVRG